MPIDRVLCKRAIEAIDVINTIVANYRELSPTIFTSQEEILIRDYIQALSGLDCADKYRIASMVLNYCVDAVVYHMGAMTLDEIGRLFGLTRERVRQIESEVLRKIKHPKTRIILRPYAHLVLYQDNSPEYKLLS